MSLTLHTDFDAGPAGLLTERELPALLEVLALLQEQLRALVELAGAKLEALRGADAAALDRYARAEEGLIAAVTAAGSERSAILARLAQALRQPGLEQLRMSAVAAVLPEPFSSAILAKSVALREITLELERKNRLAAAVARNLHEHVRSVFAAVAETQQEVVVYGANGRPDPRVARNWVDAVG